MKADDVLHERRVEAFMREARQADPVRTAAIEARYPVLTEHQVGYRDRKVRAIGFAGSGKSALNNLFYSSAPSPDFDSDAA